MDACPPWRASAAPSRSSSLSLDHLCMRRSSFEVSARILASNECGSTFMTPVSSIHHLDEMIDDLNDELLSSAIAALTRARVSSCGIDSPRTAGGSSRLHTSANPVGGHVEHRRSSHGKAQAPAGLHRRQQQQQQQHEYALMDAMTACLPPPSDSTSLQAFLRDDDSDRQDSPQSQRLGLQPAPPSMPLSSPAPILSGRLQLGKPDHPVAPNLPPKASCPTSKPTPASAPPADFLAVEKHGLRVRTSAATTPAAKVASTDSPCAVCSPTEHLALQTPEAGLSPTTTRTASHLGQVLSSGVLTSLRKTASDVVSHLRALGSGRGSRAGSRGGTAAATPTAQLAAARRSVDVHWSGADADDEMSLTGTSAAGFMAARATAPALSTRRSQDAASVVVTPPGQQQLRPQPQPQSTVRLGSSSSSRLGPQHSSCPVAAVAADRGSSGAAAPAAPASSPSHRSSLLIPPCAGARRVDGSIGDSLSGVPSSLAAGAMSSSLLWAAACRDSIGSGSASLSRTGPAVFLDEDPGSSEVLPDMWDLTRFLDEVDDGFPAASQRDRGADGKAHTAPVLMRSAAGETSSTTTTTMSLRAQLQQRRPGPSATVAGVGSGALHAGLRGHDAEQLYVLSELVQQARASEGQAASAPGSHARFQRKSGSGDPARRVQHDVSSPAAAAMVAALPAPPPPPPPTFIEGSTSPFHTDSYSRVASGSDRDSRDALAVTGQPTRLLPFFGNAAAGSLTVADPLCSSAPPRLSAAAGARTESTQNLTFGLKFQSSTSCETCGSSNIAAAPSVEYETETPAAAPPSSSSALNSGPHAGGARPAGLYGPYGINSGPFSSISSAGLLETGPELSMLWPLVMPTTVPAVLAGKPDEAAKCDSRPFVLNVLVSCGCGCGSSHGCSAAATGGGGGGGSSPSGFLRGGCNASSRHREGQSPDPGRHKPAAAAVTAAAAPPLPPPSVSAMLSGVQLAQVQMAQASGGQAALLRLPRLPAMQLVNVFAAAGGDVGPAASLLAVPPAMAAELHAIFVEKVERSLAGFLDHLAAQGPVEPRHHHQGSRLGTHQPLVRSGGGDAAAAARSAVLRAQVLRDLAVLRDPSPSCPPWSLSVPVWAACRAEWRSWMQPMLHDICYLLLCVPNCFTHGLVEWDRTMYCETLARLLDHLERHRLWQTISVLLEFCNRQGVALLYQGEAVGAGALSPERVRELLEGALHDEISIKAVGAAGTGAVGGMPGREESTQWAAAAAAAAQAAEALGVAPAAGRRSTVAALLAPNGADAAAALTLHVWRRCSVDAAGLGAESLHAAAASGCAEPTTEAASPLLVVPAGTAAAPPRPRTLYSQASIGRVLGRVLSHLAGGDDSVVQRPTGPARPGVVAAAGGPPTMTGPGGAWAVEAGMGLGGGSDAVSQQLVAGGAGAVPPAPAGSKTQRLGQMIENAAVVLAFAGLMLQSLL